MNGDKESGPLYVGIDVGGTSIKAGVVNDRGEPLAKAVGATEADRGPDVGLRNIYRVADEAMARCGRSPDDDQFAAIGLATPGTMDIPAGLLLNPPNLPGWVNLPIRRLVGEHYRRPTVLQNDANAAAYGEYWVGAGRAAHSLIFWTLGTGIGCGIIVADMIIQGEHSHGSECGHLIVQMDGGRLLPGTGHYGTLEAYAGAKAVVTRCREALDSGRESALRRKLETGMELSPLLISEAAEDGDGLANDIVMETARCLGVATTSLMHTIDPDMFLLGGAMTFGRNERDLGRRFLQRIKDEVRARAFPVPAEKTVIDYAVLGGDAGFIGAAGWARREFGQSR